MDKIRAIGDYFAALSRGDPVALAFTGFFVLLAAALGVLVWFINRRMKADDARWKERLRKRRGY